MRGRGTTQARQAHDAASWSTVPNAPMRIPGAEQHQWVPCLPHFHSQPGCKAHSRVQVLMLSLLGKSLQMERIWAVEVFSQIQWNTQPGEWNNEGISATGHEIHKLLISLDVSKYKLQKFYPSGGGDLRFQIFDAMWHMTLACILNM